MPPPATCYCGAQLQGNDATHALTCKRMLSSYQHYRHNIVTEALRNAAKRSGLSSTREPLYREPDPSGHSSGNARGDVFVIINPGPGSTAVDTVVTHPCSATSLAHGSADTPGADAAAARKRKHRALASHRVPGLKFYAYAIESYGYVDKDGMDLMRALALAGSSTGKVKYGSFLASVHREISVALCKGIHMTRKVMSMATREKFVLWFGTRARILVPTSAKVMVVKSRRRCQRVKSCLQAAPVKFAISKRI
jgi:hypothetical protein